MSIPNLRALRDWCNGRFARTHDIEEMAKSMIINGTQYYLDKNNDKWGVNTDPARGADTFVPFPDDGGSNPGSGGGPSSITLKIDTNSSRVAAVSAFCPNYYFPIQDVSKIRKVIIKNISIQAARSTTSLPTNRFYFNVWGTKQNETAGERIHQLSAVSPNVYTGSDIEIDLTDLKTIDYVQFNFTSNGTGYSINYYYTLKASCEIEIILN
ncbi:MAG: hypothetical protein HFI48_05690 [Lachnospiraceae bacterium]|nr:hypothetical protein [Lachnospiraceae bacterium]